MNRKWLSFLLALALLLALAAPAMAQDLSGFAGKLVILHTNDTHGRAISDAEGGVFGYAAVAKLKKDLTEALSSDTPKWPRQTTRSQPASSSASTCACAQA